MKSILLVVLSLISVLSFAQVSHYSNGKISNIAFNNTGINYSNGLGQLGVIGTNYNVQNAALTNPTRMFDADMSLNMSYAYQNNELPNINYPLLNKVLFDKYAITRFGNVSFHKSFKKHAFGFYHKQVFENNYSTQTDVGFPPTIHYRPNTFLNGFAYAFRIGKRFSLGTNINYYDSRYDDGHGEIYCNQNDCFPIYSEKMRGISIGLSGSYKDSYEYTDGRILKWSAATSINHFGQKNSPYDFYKNATFLPTQSYLGGMIGYKSFWNSSSSIQVSLLAQVSEELSIDQYMDINHDQIDDRIDMTPMQSLLYFIPYRRTIPYLTYNIGLEVIHETRNGIETGFRTTVLRLDGRETILYYGFHFGYDNLYLNLGSNISTIIDKSTRMIGVNVGYQVNLDE